LDVPREGPGKTGDGCFGETAIDGHAAAEEVLRRDAAEHYVSIRHRRLVAPPVAGGAGVGAGALGTHPQGTPLVEAGDGAAAGPHAEHVYGRAADGQVADTGLVALEDTARAEGDVR